MDRFLQWLGSSEFMPHGSCYLWRPGLVWLHAGSDLLIALAYMVIPVTLVIILRRRQDLPFDWIVACFGLFIVACGATHLIEVWNIWRADYWLAGGIKAITAAASIATAILLARLVPAIVALPGPTQLAVANQALTAANAELNTFAYSVAHDLRAPLRALNGLGAALQEDCAEQLSAEGQDYLRRIRSEAARMGHLVDGLLDLAQINRASVDPQRVCLSEVAERLVSELRAADPEHRVEVSIEPGVVVTGDPRLLEVMLSNLLDNAWKFTRRASPARILVGRGPDNGGQDVCFVRDNGLGFDMAHTAKLFGAFQRLHSGSEFAGTGIGLATVHRILARHGGAIWAESVVGEGSTFYFALPKAAEAAKEKS